MGDANTSSADRIAAAGRLISRNRHARDVFMAAEYAAGSNLGSVAERYGVSAPTVRAAAIAAGVPIRRPGGGPGSGMRPIPVPARTRSAVLSEYSSTGSITSAAVAGRTSAYYARKVLSEEGLL